MNDAARTRDRISRIFSNLMHLDVPSVDTDLFDAGILDSLRFVELLVELEREFGIKTVVDDLEIDNFRSVACIAEFVISSAARPAAVFAHRSERVQ